MRDPAPERPKPKPNPARSDKEKKGRHPRNRKDLRRWKGANLPAAHKVKREDKTPRAGGEEQNPTPNLPATQPPPHADHHTPRWKGHWISPPDASGASLRVLELQRPSGACTWPASLGAPSLQVKRCTRPSF